MSRPDSAEINFDQFKAIDLSDFLYRHYGLRANGSRLVLCPFHNDTKASLSLFQKNGTWGWKCHGCGAKGTLIDFVMMKEGIGLARAARRIMELERIGQERPPSRMKNLNIVRIHSYTDAEGRETWQKVKLSDGTFRCRRREGSRWVYNLEGVTLLPYHYDKVKDERSVVITEGEHDADTLTAIGVPATSGPYGKGSWPKDLTPFFADKEVRIIYDVGQDEAAQVLAKKISTVTPHVFILKVPLPNHEDDITDYLSRFPDNDSKHMAFMDILAKGENILPKWSDDDAPLSLRLSEVEARNVPWLWRDFIPLGRATLISGDPGSAKTWFCLDLTCRLSRGLPWPDESLGIGPAQTIYLTVEDDIHDTIRPRVDSLGGDASMIFAYNSDHPLHLDLNSPEGLKRLEDEVIRLENVKLVIVDPIVDFSGDVNPNTTEEVRALLTPLVRLAAKHSFALVLIGHLNKAQALSAIYRAGGTTGGWLGKCRAAFMIFRDVDDRTLRHVVPLKANLAHQDPAQLEFRINNGHMDIGVSTNEIDPDEQLNPQRGPNPREREEAVKWLNDFFADRTEIPATEVEKAAKADMISESTLKRAKKATGYRSIKRTESGGKTVWVWTRVSNCL